MIRGSKSVKALSLAALLLGVAVIGVNPRGHRPASPEAIPTSRAPLASATLTSQAEPRPEAATTSSVPSTVPAGVPDAAESTPMALPPSTLANVDALSLDAAIARVEEARGASDTIETPEELRHYDDRRRFLAVQVAASRDDKLDLPHDEAALAEMILRGELVELAPLTQDHVLYEIGTSVNIDPRTHYDAERNKNVPLFSSYEEYVREDARLAREGAGRSRAAAKAREQREFLADYYKNATLRQQLFREYGAITQLARDFGGTTYVLEDANQRARFVARLLSFIRPAARDVLLKLARSYRMRFDRPLPIASLVRTSRYQRQLARVNSNASRVEASPHLSGEAFDISYKFMAPDEQNFVMNEVAQLERQGLVEALRERNNSLHVYVFADGQRPSDAMVAEYLDEVEAQQGMRRAPPRRSRGAAARGAARAQRRR
jgi:hypothetical protein